MAGLHNIIKVLSCHVLYGAYYYRAMSCVVPVTVGLPVFSDVLTLNIKQNN